MSLGLLDYRRRTAGLYSAYREATPGPNAVATWRAGREHLVHDHPHGVLRGSQRGPLPYAAYDASVRHELDVEVDVEPRHLDVATDSDGVVAMDRLGLIDVPGVGAIDVWWLGQYGGGVFVPLRDATAGHTTYGGGRYLLDTAKGADLGSDVDPVTGRGRLVVDLNLAYHPSCAYDPRWSCPLAPPGNTVEASVAAGELLPPGGWY